MYLSLTLALVTLNYMVAHERIDEGEGEGEGEDEDEDEDGV